MKPLIIGEAPSKNQDPPHPIEGRIGQRLADLSGLTLPEFLAHFDRTNLIHVRQDTAAHGFQFDMPLARRRAEVLAQSFRPNQIVLLLGQRVAMAFGFSNRTQPFVQHHIHGAEVRIVPHPSGINRWWNEPKNEDAAKVFMRTIVERTK